MGPCAPDLMYNGQWMVLPHHNIDADLILLLRFTSAQRETQADARGANLKSIVHPSLLATRMQKKSSRAPDGGGSI